MKNSTLCFNDVTVGDDDVPNCTTGSTLSLQYTRDQSIRSLSDISIVKYNITKCNDLSIKDKQHHHCFDNSKYRKCVSFVTHLQSYRQESSIRFHKYCIRFNTAHQAACGDFKTWDKVGNLPSFSCSYITTVCTISVEKYRLSAESIICFSVFFKASTHLLFCSHARFCLKYFNQQAAHVPMLDYLEDKQKGHQSAKANQNVMSWSHHFDIKN